MSKQEKSQRSPSNESEATEVHKRPDPRGIPVENEVVTPQPNASKSERRDLASILEAASGWSTDRSSGSLPTPKPIELKLPLQNGENEEVPAASVHPNEKVLSSNRAHDREEITDQDLIELTIEQFKEKLQSGHWTCLQLTEAYIDRINRLDGQLHAVLELNPDAAALAKQLDDNFDELGSLPLYGVPILLKDNIDTADRMTTTAGSLALRGRRAKRDAFAVAKLREAGAILLGKVNMTEYANYMSWKMPSGYSSRGGQTHNPYGDYPVGGSSSGSAAAVSANFSLGALGSETSGSIVDPSACQSVVGIKPTVGLISRSGVVPLTLTQDTLGPIARTVLDAALILEAMTFGDAADACTLLPQRPESFLPGRDDMPVKMKVGVPKPMMDELDDETAVVFEQALSGLSAAGIEVVRDIDLPAYTDEWDGTVMRREFKTALNAFLAAQPKGTVPADLAELLSFNREHADECLRYGQELLEAAEQDNGRMDDELYRTSKERGVRRGGEEGIDQALQQYGVHALAFVNSEGADMAARAGYPLVCVPAGYTASGQPVGLMLSGTAMSDPLLIEIAYRFEQATKLRKAPDLSV